MFNKVLTSRFLVIIFVTLSLLSALYFTVAANVQQNIQAAELKSKMGIDIEDNTVPTAITKEQAIESAKKTFSDVVASTNITAQSNLMTYTDFTDFSPEALNKNPTLKAKKHLDKTPVWIVSFKGLKILRAGGVNLTDDDRLKTAHNEENVVIDSSTGIPLFSFSYR